MRLFGPLLALMALGIAGYILYGARQQYESTPADQKNYPPALRTAIHEASVEKKNVVAMFTATWCGPCHRMKTEVIPSSVVQVQAKRFVWVYLDVDDPANQAAAREFGVSSIPSFRILNGQGRELDKMVGGRDPQSFAGFLARY